MLTGVAFPPGRLPRSFPGFPGAWLFVFIIILLIALIFTRVYAGRRPVRAGDWTPVPAADCTRCRPRAGTRRKPRASKQHPDDDRTGRDQESST